MIISNQGVSMGEKIKDLGRIRFSRSAEECVVELNYPPSGLGQRQIHFQSSSFRAEMTESEFMQFCAAVKLAATKLRKLKKLL